MKQTKSAKLRVMKTGKKILLLQMKLLFLLQRKVWLLQKKWFLGGQQKIYLAGSDRTLGFFCCFRGNFFCVSDRFYSSRRNFCCSKRCYSFRRNFCFVSVKGFIPLRNFCFVAAKDVTPLEETFVLCQWKVLFLEKELLFCWSKRPYCFRRNFRFFAVQKQLLFGCAKKRS